MNPVIVLSSERHSRVLYGHRRAHAGSIGQVHPRQGQATCPFRLTLGWGCAPRILMLDQSHFHCSLASESKCYMRRLLPEALVRPVSYYYFQMFVRSLRNAQFV